MTYELKATSKIFGIGVLVFGAVAAWTLGEILPWPNPLLIAVLIGTLFGNIVREPGRLAPGINTHSFWLAAGIVLMGASVSLGALLAGGPVVLVLIVAVVGLTVVLLETIAHVVFGLQGRLASLLAVGTGICGVSAIVAVAGSIDANEETIAYAVGIVLMFDAVTLVLYPVIGSAVAIPDQVFGIWAGVSMFSTGPVVLAGFTHSEIAGQWATVTKLGRNALIGVMVLIYTGYYARRGFKANSKVKYLWNEFPNFVFGFLILAIAASAGFFSSSIVSIFKSMSNWLFLMAFVGLGTELNPSVFTETGLRPLAIVLLTWFVVASTTLPIIWLLFG